jgi:hypothetical protein
MRLSFRCAIAVLLSACGKTPDPKMDGGGMPGIDTCVPEITNAQNYSGTQGSFTTTVHAQWTDDPVKYDTLMQFVGMPMNLLATFEGKPTVGEAPVRLTYTQSGSWRPVDGGIVFDAVEGSKVTMHMDEARMVPSACLAAGKNCGFAPEVCFGTVSCGSCGAGETCGGGGTANVCGVGDCNTVTCQTAPYNCGVASDGCAGILKCGKCTDERASCGNPDGGQPNTCWIPPCTPTTSCADAGKNCGQILDGCGQILACGGACTAPATCLNNRCGTLPVPVQPTCTPKSCADQQKNCGVHSDYCSGLIKCGTCDGGSEACGRGGEAGVCDDPVPAKCTVGSGSFTLSIPACQANVSGL